MTKLTSNSSAPERRKVKTGKNVNIAKPQVSTEQRLHYIEVAAYYIAQRRGFDGGDPVKDWVAAELEIDRLLAEGRFMRSRPTGECPLPAFG